MTLVDNIESPYPSFTKNRGEGSSGGGGGGSVSSALVIKCADFTNEGGYSLTLGGIIAEIASGKVEGIPGPSPTGYETLILFDAHELSPAFRPSDMTSGYFPSGHCLVKMIVPPAIKSASGELIPLLVTVWSSSTNGMPMSALHGHCTIDRGANDDYLNFGGIQWFEVAY